MTTVSHRPALHKWCRSMIGAATWYLWNTNAYGPPSIIVPNYGTAGDKPVAGNWDGQ